MKKQKLLLVATMLLGAQAAQGAGFEKSVMWSGKEGGYAGAGQSRVTGSQSIVFNPAGLAGAGDAAINFSPTFLKSEGYLVSNTKKEESEHGFSPIGAVTASYRVNERFGFGVGAYVSAGSKAIYDGVDFTSVFPNVTLMPTVQTDFRVIEYSVGAGYEVAPGFRLGAAWRILDAKGGLSTAKRMTLANAVNYLNIVDAKKTKYNGFRLGAQYQAPEDSWGVGATFRNGVDIVAEGKINGATQLANGTNVPGTFSPQATLGTSLPWAASLGGHYLMGSLRLMGAVDYVNYAKNKELKIGATLNNNALPNIALQWKDMWNVRVGTEYSGLDVAKLRLGYALTTKVTPADHARATLSPPGTGHLVTVGAGTTFWDKFDLDGAVEYAFNSGSGSMTAGTTGAGATTSQEFLAGVDTETKVTSLAVHTGLTYRF